jgi:Sec7-like guanine-nucleotide exchange factor
LYFILHATTIQSCIHLSVSVPVSVSVYVPVSAVIRILSLEMILHILQRCGPGFRSGERFIYAIKQYLCVSLLGNCTSSVNQVTGLALHVFVALLDGFKEHLKAELEVFVTNIFLSILASENSTFEHKSRVLEVFHNICGDPGGQVELFINYDCDFESIDLFRRIVDAFSKISKNPTFFLPRNAEFLSSKKSISEEHTIRHLGLEGLVIILRSLMKSSGIGLPKEKKDASATPVKARESINGLNIAALRGENFEGDDGSVHMSPLTEEEEGVNVDETIHHSASMESSRTEEDHTLRDEGGEELMKTYDRKHKIKEEMENGILKFNLSPKKGLKYLSSLGHIENTAVGIATFFRQYGEKLDKTAIGEYLGREKEYEGGICVRVLHEYVDSMDFGGMHFDEAIRMFLSGFRLPGEAQKIDRMMEKFAERYYIANKTVFASADMAFILAFSTIMLQTNLHNPAIKEDKRMTKEQFIKQNKGISSDGELPESMLMDIYDRIQATPISLNQDERNRKSKKDDQSFFASMSQDKRRKDAFNDERKEMMRSSEALFKQRSKSKVQDKSAFKHADQTYESYARPMFEVAWAPMISVFSQIIETVDDYDLIALCLEGFRLSIRLASRLDVYVARDTYVNALVKFTTLDSVKEMRFKHIDAIKLLINVALTDGDYLFESWGQILRGLSHLSRLTLFGNRLHSDDLFFADTSNSKGSTDRRGSGSKKRPSSYNVQNMEMSSIDQFTKLFTGPSRAETSRLIEESNAELIMREIDPVMIDRIFINSQNLSSESVLHFVENLCAISLEEISTTNNNSLSCLRGKEANGDSSMAPRVFSLQKLVEVADFNMHVRPRISWTKLWSVLAAHFTAVGVDDNHALSMFAIDSLKQLSIKFLQKEELSNFNFQRLFLKPFEVIMNKSKSAEIKELILRCIDIMVLACASNIHSGWRSLFSVFRVAAAHPKADIAGIAFEITERLMTQQFDLLIFDFVELMNCLVAFVAGPHSMISLSALSHLSKCADHLAQGKVSAAIDNQHTSSDAMGISWEKSKSNMEQIGEDAAVFRLWWPLLLGLSTRVADHRLVIRTRAVETLHSVLSTYGHLFSPQIWEVIFKGVLFPIMDSAKTDNTLQPQSLWPTHNPVLSKDPASWIATSAATVLSVCLQLFDQYYEAGLSSPFIADVVTMLQSCIGQDIESLARMGLDSLRTLVRGLRHDVPSKEEDGEPTLCPHMADLLCARLCDVTLSNLCMDFGGNAILKLDDATAPIVLELVRKWKTSPLGSTSRKDNRNMEIEESDFDVKSIAVDTPYGVGKVVSSMGKDTNAKHTIILGWGATLYSFDQFPTAEHVETERSMLTPRLTDEQRWLSLSCEAMTSMVLSLDIIDAIGDMLNTHYSSLRVNHLKQLLGVLQASYDHARCFNADDELRALLRARNFMRFGDNSARLPHLLEQETQAASQLLTYSFRLYQEENNSKANGKVKSTLAEPIIKRISCKMMERYLLIDELSLTSTDFFIEEQLAIYAPPVMLALNGIAGFTTEQFARNMDWVLPLLSDVTICNNRMVRECVKEVYEKRVNTVLIK